MFWVDHQRADAIFEAECRAAGLFLNERIMGATTVSKMRSGIPIGGHELDEGDGLGARLRWYCWDANLLMVFTINLDHDPNQVVIATPSHTSIGKQHPWQVIELLGPTPPRFLEHISWIRPAEGTHSSAVGLREDPSRVLEVYRAVSSDESIQLARRLVELFPGVDYVVTKPINF